MEQSVVNFVSLGCVGTTTRVVKMRSWNPGAIGERRALGRPYLVLYTPARLFFYCDRILRLHWDCNRIEDCSRIVGNAMAFEHGLDGFLQCCDRMKEFIDTACLELMLYVSFFALPLRCMTHDPPVLALSQSPVQALIVTQSWCNGFD